MAMGERELSVLQGWRKHIAGDTLLEPADIFLAIGNDDQIKELKKLVENKWFTL